MLFSVACILTSAACAATPPVVHTTLGKVLGKVSTAEDSKKCEAWLGIPYAEPPLGAQRFRPPRSYTAPFPSDGFNASSYGRWCPQLGDGPDYGDEDCLKLNVWRPIGTTPSSNLAVMVWIYGGAFVNGDDGDRTIANTYDACGLAARHRILAMGMNYRVGPFGFLAFASDTASGKVDSNFGVMDQREALRWVQREIHNFGGNPAKVTIFGESAGGISVWYHIASPKSKGLFHAAISQSGIPHAVTGTWSVNRSKAYAAKLGCEDASDIRSCLTNKSVKEIIDAANEAANPFTDPGWNPCVDGDDMPMQPGLMMNDSRASAVPVLAGFNTDECNAFVYPSFPLRMSKSQFYNFTMQSINKDPQWDPQHVLNHTDVQQIYKKYPLSWHTDNRAVAASLLSDSTFICGQLVPGLVYSARADFYVYRFNRRTSFAALIPGVYHGLDLPYVFGTPASFKGTFTKDEADLSSRMQAIWTNFAKYHVPRGGSTAFPKFTNATLQSLVLDTPGDVVEAGYRSDYCKFWADMYQKEGFLKSFSNGLHLSKVSGPRLPEMESVFV